MLTRVQNVLTGWGCGIGITFVVVALQYENYGGESRVLFSKVCCWIRGESRVPAASVQKLRLGKLEV
jgi:hypothetical protein